MDKEKVLRNIRWIIAHCEGGKPHRFAVKLDKSDGNVRAWLLGQTFPKDEALRLISEKYGYPLEWVRGEVDSEVPTQQIAAPAPPRHQDEDDDCRRQLDIARAKLEMLQQCYDKLLDRVTPQHHTTPQQQPQETPAPRGHDNAKDRRIGTHSGH